MTALTTALMAGLFFAFSCAVNLGLARLSNPEYISAMQSINRAIQNLVFFIAFFGAPIFQIISTVFYYDQSNRLWLLFVSTLIYLTGTFGVTVFGNVPLNNALDGFELESASEAETALQRANFERSWNNLNTIRTVSSMIALVLVVLACLN